VIPEYALLLGILVIGAALACVIAGSSVDRTFSVAARFTSSPGAADARTADANPRQPDGSHTSGDQLSPRVARQQQIALVLAAGVGILVFGVTVTCGVGVLRLMRPRERREVGELSTGDQTVLPAMLPSMREQLMEKRQQIRHILSRDLEKAAGFDTQVQHLMSKRLSVVNPDMAVAQAVATMDEKRIRHLLVCAEDGSLHGILSDRDIKQRSGAVVRDIMSSSPVTVPPDMSMGPAITLMLQQSISCLPVVRDGALLGVLTTTDILLSCQCMMQVLERVAAGLYDRRENDALLADPC
jgi:CBS domain-containing protein